MSKTRVFVYGTLKAGHPNSRALEDCELLGACYLDGQYRMLDLGWYPAVIQDEAVKEQRIFGEVYEVSEDVLYTLDCIEGHPEYYKREKVRTPWKNAWMYFLPCTYKEKGFPTVMDGVWKPSEAEQNYVSTVNAAHSD